MFACIFFNEDTSLSVVGEKNRNLTLLNGSFKVKEEVKMLWKKAGKSVVYHGTIVQTSDDEEWLTNYATQANSQIIKKLQEKPTSVPDALFTFRTQDQNKLGKRQRKVSEKVREMNTEQDSSDVAPKLFKKTKSKTPNSTSSTPSIMTTPSTAQASKKKAEEQTTIEIGRQMMSCMEGQFSQESMPSTPTTLTSTWNLCRSAMDIASTSAEVCQIKPPDLFQQQIGNFPVPSTSVLQTLRAMLQPDFMDFLHQMVAHFSPDGTSFEKSSQGEYDMTIEFSPDAPMPLPMTDLMSTTTPMSSASPLGLAPLVSASLLTSPLSMPSQSTQSQSSPLSSPLTLPSLLTLPHSSPMSSPSTLPEQSFPSTVPSTLPQFSFMSSPSNLPTSAIQQQSISKQGDEVAVPLRRSPRKNADQDMDEDTSSMVKLLESSSIKINKDGLRNAISRAKKSCRPGYTLCYNLASHVFTVRVLAGCRGLGLTENKKKDPRPPLDKTGVQIIKEYVAVWCKKNGYNAPLESTLNDAFTERISYARKQAKKMN